MKLHHLLAIAALAGSLPLAALAQGQAVWRCGPDGRVFSDTPCAQGRLVATADSRPASDVQAAREVAQREQRLADKLLEERVRRETVAPGAGLAGIGPVNQRIKPLAKKSPHKRSRLHQRSADDETWPAVVPASRQKRG